MKEFNFSNFSRQSPKGIVIYYLLIIYKLFKFLWILIPSILLGEKEHKIEKIAIVLGSVIVLALVLAILQYLFFKFKIEKDNFLVNKGVFFKSRTSIPLDRIQHVNFKQNLVHQIINVTQVEIETAGAKRVEVSIKAISKQKAEELKRRLLSLGIKMDSEEEGLETETKADNKALYSLSFLDLLKVSFSENHVRSFFWVVASIFSFYNQLDEIIKDNSVHSKIVQFYVDNENVVNSSFYLLLILFFVALIISVFVSFVRVVLLHFNQKITHTNDGIEIKEGLFTKRENVLKIKKIQYSISVTNPFKQIMGIRTIRIKQAGDSSKGKKRKMLELVGLKKKVASILNDLFFKYDESEDKKLFKPAKYYLYKLFVLHFLLLAVLNCVMYFQFSVINNIVLNGLLIPFFINLVLLRYKKSYFVLDNKKLIIGRGQISTVTTLMEYYKAQNVKLVQNVIQKRRGVATLHLQTASGVLKMKCLKESDADWIMNTIVTEASETNKNWI